MERLTLFFMLHCGKPLYNSVLWANWGPGLSNVIILGNRFSSYQERYCFSLTLSLLLPRRLGRRGGKLEPGGIK